MGAACHSGCLEMLEIELIGELPQLKNRGTADIKKDPAAENRHVPERQSGADVSGPHYSLSSFKTNPIPRTVCRSLFGNGSSIFRRRRAI